MFLFEKYRPKTINDFIFNKDILSELIYIASNDDIPHIIISGPPGGGKKTLIKPFLEALYNEDVNILTKMKYNINGGSTKKEIEIFQSSYHIVIEPTNTNRDKYILQEIIKQYAMHKSFVFKANRNFKTIVIHNIENLANNSQAALRRTMELYARTCRFVMVCNNLSKIFDPLRSRCRTFCVKLPSVEDISTVLTHIGIMEKIKLNADSINSILNSSNMNLKKAIWMLDLNRLGCPNVIALDKAFNVVIKNILKVRTSDNIINIFDRIIRSNNYNILITNIKGSDIIITLLDALLLKIDDNEINARIIQCASEAEYNLIHGRRDIMHIDYFIAGVMKQLRN